MDDMMGNVKELSQQWDELGSCGVLMRSSGLRAGLP